MRGNRWFRRIALVGLGIALMTASYVALNGRQVASATAVYLSYAQDCNFTAYGRTACNGYLTNTDWYSSNDGGVPENDIIINPADPTSDAIPMSVDSGPTFIAFYENYLSQGSPTHYDFDSLGAAVTMEIMLGVNGADVCNWYNGSSTCTWQAAIAYAQDPAHLADWEARVNYYASQPGWINWTGTLNEGVGVPDSGHVCTTSTAACWGGYPGYPPSSPASADGQDVAWSGNVYPGIQNVIEFNNPDGSQFVLDRLCSNEIGDTDGIAASAFAVTPSISSSTYNVLPGETYQLTVGAFNTGPGNATAGSLQVQLPGDITRPCAGTCTGAAAGMTDLSPPGATSSYLFDDNSANADPGVSGSWWEWNVNPLPQGEPLSGTVTFTVAPGAATGSIITFTVYFHPSDPQGDTATATVSFLVGSDRAPTVVGINGDIHAGGGVCGQAQNSSGDIDTNAGSYGGYAVSAPGTIVGMGSNASPTDTSLQLGNGGGYTTVCRPDLYQAAINDPPSGVNYLDGGTYDLGADFNGGSNITMENGKAVAFINGDVNLSGAYSQNRPLTLVVTGNVTITGDTTVSGGTNRNDLPSLGIIASGDIDIDDAATTVDAMLFSDSAIDTCYTPGGPVPGQCDDVLTVKGLLMAQNILLNRLGPTGP